MINLELNTKVVAKKITFSWNVEEKLDIFHYHLIKKIKENDSSLFETVDSLGFDGEIRKLVHANFKKYFSHIGEFNSNNTLLMDMCERNVYFYQKSDDLIYYEFTNFGICRFHSEYFLSDEQEKFMKPKIKKVIGDNEIASTVESIEPFSSLIKKTPLKFSVDLKNLNVIYIEKKKYLISEENITEIKELISEKQHYFHSPIVVSGNVVDELEFLSDDAYRNITWKYDVVFSENDKFQNVISIKVNKGNFEINTCYVNENGIQLFKKENLDFIEIIKAKKEGWIQKLIQIHEKEKFSLDAYQNFNYIKQLLLTNDNSAFELVNYMIKTEEKLVDKEFIDYILDEKLENHIKLPIDNVEVFIQLIEKISNEKKHRFAKLFDLNMIHSIKKPSVLRKLSSSLDEMFTNDQKQILKDYLMNAQLNYDLLVNLIGEISLSGLREISKELSNDEKNKIGFTKDTKNWLDKNLGHNKGFLDKFNIDKNRIDKAEAVKKVADACVELVKEKHKK